jgi:deazaflavin-dependent oxidoreductase (nitroreductase family)
MPNPIKTALDSALKIAKDPATNAKLKSGLRESASTVKKVVKDPAKVKTNLKDGSAWVANRAHPAVIRLTHGKVGSKVGDAPILVLTTTGRKSGKPRSVPLCYLTDGDRLVVIASYGGDDRAPLWFQNLQADPAVTVEVDGKRTPMTASVADAATRARLWPQAVAMYKGYEGYQRKTDREIPLVLLTPNP